MHPSSRSAPLRHSTVSMAVGASCVDNAQNQMLATLLASQIARAAAIVNVDEVVVLDDVARPNKDVPSPAASMLAKILQYLETPQYLRKYAGLDFGRGWGHSVSAARSGRHLP